MSLGALDGRTFIKRFAAGEGEEGRWITVNGAHILIKEGETTEDAFKRTAGEDIAGDPTANVNEKIGKLNQQYEKNGLKFERFAYEIPFIREQKGTDQHRAITVRSLYSGNYMVYPSQKKFLEDEGFKEYTLPVGKRWVKVTPEIK